MTLDKQKLEGYLKEKGKEGDFSITSVIINLSGMKEEIENNSFLSEWLKNDKDLMDYAELFSKKEQLKGDERVNLGLLEMKLSFTCSYFKDFQEFLEEMKRETDTSMDNTSGASSSGTVSSSSGSITSTSQSTSTIENNGDSNEFLNHTFCGTKIKDIQSEPFNRSSRTGVTRCSQTARYNGYHFGIDLPRGNAYDAGQHPGKDCIQTIPSNRLLEIPEATWESVNLSNFTVTNEGNYADIYTDSKSGYGHRAAAFKDDRGQWYVLDPYTRVNGKLDNSPKKLEDYLKIKKIVKAHIYKSDGYKNDIPSSYYG